MARRTQEMALVIRERAEGLRHVQHWMLAFERLYGATSRRLQEALVGLQRASNYRDPLRLAQAVQLCDVSVSMSTFQSYSSSAWRVSVSFSRTASGSCGARTPTRPSCTATWRLAREMAPWARWTTRLTPSRCCSWSARDGAPMTCSPARAPQSPGAYALGNCSTAPCVGRSPSSSGSATPGAWPP